MCVAVKCNLNHFDNSLTVTLELAPSAAEVMEGEIVNLCITIDSEIERSVTVSIDLMDATAVGRFKQLKRCTFGSRSRVS